MRKNKKKAGKRWSALLQDLVVITKFSFPENNKYLTY